MWTHFFPQESENYAASHKSLEKMLLVVRDNSEGKYLYIWARIHKDSKNPLRELLT